MPAAGLHLLLDSCLCKAVQQQLPACSREAPMHVQGKSSERFTTKECRSCTPSREHQGQGAALCTACQECYVLPAEHHLTPASPCNAGIMKHHSMMIVDSLRDMVRSFRCSRPTLLCRLRNISAPTISLLNLSSTSVLAASYQALETALHSLHGHIHMAGPSTAHLQH